MRVVMLSQDMTAFESDSPFASRIRSYGSIVDSLTVIVFGVGQERTVTLAPHVRIVAAGGSNKLSGFLNGRSALTKEVEQKQLDLISAHDPFFIGMMATLVGKKHRVPVQIQVHTDCFSFAYAFSSLRSCIEVVVAFFTLKNASCIRVVSERVARKVRAVARVPVTVLPIRVPDVSVAAITQPPVFQGRLTTSSEERNEVLAHSFRPSDDGGKVKATGLAPYQGRAQRVPLKRGGLPPRTFTILSVSRLTSEKRLWLLIDALEGLPDVDLVIVGEGPLLTNLKQRAATKGVSGRVHFVGHQNPHPYYAHADALVHVSRYEGYGMTLIEAALHNMPIITTDVGVVGEVLHNDTSALVVSPHVGAIRDAAKKLIGDEALRKQLGEAACKNARVTLVSESEYLTRYRQALATCLL